MKKRIAALLLAALLLPAGMHAEEVTEEIITEEEILPAESGPLLTEDEENGIWRYESPELRIEITRYNETVKIKKKNYQRIYCVAEIWASEASPLGFVMTEGKIPGRKQVSPELLTDKYQPVFAMSDDMYGLRLRKLDDGRYKYDYHGTVIRYGEILARKTRNSAKKRQWPNLDTMAVFGDGSVKTFVCDAHTPEEYLEMGAVHVMAFGPWLLSGGEINPDVLDPNYYPYNEPRAAIGMVEPYHYVAIAAQGRPDGKYAGVHLDWMAEKMKEMGCTEALNLDGGATVTMFFNGKVILTGQVKTVKKQTVPDLRSQGSLIAFGLPENAPAAEK